MGREGYKCSSYPWGNNCLPSWIWCDKSRPYHCDELNTTATSLSTDAVVCRNQTFWEGRPCGDYRHRCTATRAGECGHERFNKCADGSDAIKPANNEKSEGGDSTGKKSVTCRARDGKFKGKKIVDNSIQCHDGADETGCDEEYIRMLIFTINDKHRCNSVYLNFTRSDGSSGRFYPERGIR